MKPKKIKDDTFFGDFLYAQAVPKDHELRLLTTAINWNLIRKELMTDEAGNLIEYSYVGAPATDPLILFKLLLLQRWHPTSDRQVVKRAETDLSYRFFLGLPVPEKIPNYSNLSRFRGIWGKDKLQNCFKLIFHQIQQYGYADVSKGIVGDLTHSHARIARPSARELIFDCFVDFMDRFEILVDKWSKLFDQRRTRHLFPAFQTGIREYNAQIQEQSLSRQERFELLVLWVLRTQVYITVLLPDPFPKETAESKEFLAFSKSQAILNRVIAENVQIEEPPPETKDSSKIPPPKPPKISQKSRKKSKKPRATQRKGNRKIISRVDPEVRAGCKAKKRFFIGPKISATMTQDDFLASVDAVPGNLPDGSQAIEMVQTAIANSNQIPAYLGLDKGFDSQQIRIDLHKMGIQPGIEFSKAINPRNKALFTATSFRFDPQNLSVTCPAEIQTQNYTPNYSTGTYLFSFPQNVCKSCHLREQCTTSKTGRIVTFSQYYELLERDKQFLKSVPYQKSRKKRWNLESRFGNGKHAHNLGITPYRGIEKAGVHHLLVGMVLNLKKLLKMQFFASLPASPAPLPSGASV